MFKKPISKLISFVLTLAICITTVLGCFVTVSAQDTPSYVITAFECNEGDPTASATVEFNVPQGMATGTFTIDNTNSWYSSVEVSLYSALVESTDKVEIEEYAGNVLFYITDSTGNAKTYTNIVFKLDFVFAGGGITEDVKIKISDLDFNGLYSDENYTEFTNKSTQDEFTLGCKHNYVASGKVYSSTELGYTVYSDATCKKCGETKGDYQIVPELPDNDGEIVVYSGSASSAPGVSLLNPNDVNSKENPYIIELPTQLHALSAGALTNTAGENVSEIGAYFKVKDGIKAFVMQDAGKYSAQEIMNLSSWEEVYAKLDYETNGKAPTIWWPTVDSSSGRFSGHFDGNGVEIFGVYSGVWNDSGNNSGARGLFTTVYGDSSFKNFSVKNSYIAFNNWMGGGAIVGSTGVTYSDTATTVHNVDRVTIENCEVSNNYIAQLSNNQSRGASALIGFSTFYTVGDVKYNDEAVINNCLIYGNKLDNSIYESATGSKAISGLISYGGGSNGTKITNVISLGVTPWTTNGGGWYIKQINDGTIKNVYTDASQADWDAFAATNANNNLTNAQKHNINFAIDVNTLKGDAAATTANVLDWNTESNPDGVWFTGNAGQYPTLLKKNSTPLADATNPDWELLGVNLVYKNDGGFDINFHYKPAYESDVTLYVANAESEYKSHVLTEHKTSSLAGTTLPENARMFTISNLSARDIDILWLPTIVTTSSDGSETVYGETKQISIGGYAKDVVMGNAFYSQDATESEKAADKKVAAALINYGQASSAALSSANVDASAMIVENWDGRDRDGKWIGWTYGTFRGEGTKKSPYIIEYAEQLAHLTTAGASTYDTTVGKYYKVDDSIKALNMNTTGLDLSGDMTTTEVKAFLAEEVVGRTYWTSAVFAGTFDGNGVEIYGLHAGLVNYGTDSSGAQLAALFPRVAAGTTIKNLTLKNSYLSTSNTDAGGLIAMVTADAGNTADTVYIENCIVHDCYIGSTNQNNAPGVIAGNIGSNAYININNIFVYGNEINNAKNSTKSIVGIASKNANSTTLNRLTNSIVLDATPYDANGSWWFKACDHSIFQNVYFDQTAQTSGFGNYGHKNSKLTQLSSVDDAKGIAAKTNMPSLDWETVWFYGNEGEYPSIVLTDAMVNPISIYSGTPDTTSTLSGTGSENDPYIIGTADQFASIALGKRTSTEDTYYKVKDGIKSFYIQGGDAVANMTDVEQVKAYFEQNATPTSSTWTRTNSFTGHFDGNGVTVYGLYCYNIGQYTPAGLFPQVTGHSSIKNITIKNSYISSDYNDGFGAIVGSTLWVNGGAYENSVEFENIAVINNYICQRRDIANGASAIGGSFYNKNYATVNNCIVYGNEIDNDAYTSNTGLLTGLFTANGGLGSGEATGLKIKNVISLGVTPWLLKQTGDNTYTHTNWYLANMSTGVFENIYTDQSVAALQTYDSNNNSASNLGKFNINVVSSSSLQGSNALSTTASANFAWDTTWYAGSYNDYPSFTPTGSLPSNIQTQYDSVTFDARDTVGGGVEYHTNDSMSFGVYQTALSLKANPYMSFAFAFLGDYRTNRENIEVRFTYTQDGQTVVGEAIAVPAYEEGKDIVNVNGWTNTASNGRYHTYKATDIPVEALANGIKVEANYNGEGWKDFGTYSVSGLGIQFERANRLNPSEYYETRVEAAKALLFYVQAIESRYGA